MKKTGRIFLSAFLFVAILTSCAKNEGNLNQASLKQAIDQGAVKLNTAMNTISATQAYSILTMNEGSMMKSSTATDSIYRVYIPLEKIKGVYEYNKVSKHNNWGMSFLHFFTKTADNSQMIVRMPLKKVTRPGNLRHYSKADSSLTNNFSIAVSDYHNNYNSFRDYDYVLSSEISVDNVVAGNLNINTLISPTLGTHYTSQYAFAGSYTAKYKYESGDTTSSSFTIMNGANILYEEKLFTIKNDTAKFGREHQYILTIGNVQIIRNSDTKKVQIAVDGVVQPGAVVTILDKEGDKEGDNEASVCKKRDIQITFEDGTVKTVSALIGESVNNIKTLYSSLHQVYFAAYIVDWIAYDIYYQR
jgi:hypothetical protein